jgi:hypothetical protein
MHYLPLPRTVVPAVAIATLVLLIWLAWGSMQDPETFWAPGRLSRYHAGVARCTSCHEPFRGPITAKCILCHSEAPFAERSMPSPAAFHHEIIRQRQTCLGCHTEHRGALAQITSSATTNPHGAFIFTATGTASCAACHVFGRTYGSRPTVIDNDTVRGLLGKGGGAHRPGRMADCLQCHAADQGMSRAVE